MFWVLGLFVMAFAGIAWLDNCNRRTFKQRMRIIDEIAAADVPDWRAFISVTYDRHMWTIATFRDWRKLYRESEAGK